ncbi:MAG: hypothetical protein IJ363_13925 [Clostridia bacterium]|nr:hypothetical protein [Clostridia bacterium]
MENDKTKFRWFVDDKGIIWVHRPMGDYVIYPEQFMEMDWLQHMADKSWVDLNTFVPAFQRAFRLSGQSWKEYVKKFNVDGVARVILDNPPEIGAGVESYVPVGGGEAYLVTIKEA